MKTLKNYANRFLTAAVTLAVGGFCLTAQAQSNDALIDVLIKKGILTKEEATAVRTEAA